MTPWVGPLKLGLNLSWDSLLPLASIECIIKMFFKNVSIRSKFI